MLQFVLTPAQRATFADKLPDTGNLALGAMFFVQFVGDTFSWVVAALGIALWTFFLVCAAIVSNGSEL